MKAEFRLSKNIPSSGNWNDAPITSTIECNSHGDEPWESPEADAVEYAIRLNRQYRCRVRWNWLGDSAGYILSL